LKQYEATGEIVPSARKRDNYFSEEMWINTALRYRTAIQNLSEKSWDCIIDGAWKIAQAKKVAGRATSSNIFKSDDQIPKVDERELLVEGDEDVENDDIDWEACESFYCPLRALVVIGIQQNWHRDSAKWRASWPLNHIGCMDIGLWPVGDSLTVLTTCLVYVL
jgi:hypothetical protein